MTWKCKSCVKEFKYKRDYINHKKDCPKMLCKYNIKCRKQEQGESK